MSLDPFVLAAAVAAPGGDAGYPTDLAVETADLVKVYRTGTRANDGISLAVRRGEVFGLLGPNGAGKSTFVQQVQGLMRPTSGTVRVFGVDAARHPDAVKRLIGYMPQTAFAMRDLLVEEAIYFTARLKGLSHGDTLAQRAALMREFGLDDVRRQPISQLSGGMQRTVGFVMALLGRPPLLVLDEPTNDLDPLRRRVVWDAIRRSVAEDGAACLLVTHNVLEAEHVVDRVALVNAGRLVAQGSPGALKARVGEGIRLDLFLQDGSTLTESQLTQLAAIGTLRRPRRQQLSLIVPPEAIGATVDRVLTLIGPAALADFRLATISLEDVYVELVGRTLREADESGEEEGSVPPNGGRTNANTSGPDSGVATVAETGGAEPSAPIPVTTGATR